MINAYAYKPVPIFYGDGRRYLGVELEIDEGGESKKHAEQLLEIANASAEHIYIKRDGSLSDGLELVSHPATLEYHLEHMPWKALLSTAVQLGYCSHTAGAAGLHVHVNRDSFGDTVEAQEAAIGGLLFFVENHWYELLRFSRRTQRQLDQWAVRYGRKDNPKEMMKHSKQYCDRYRAINLLNSHTVEV